MIEFIYHEQVVKEIAALERRFRHVKDGLHSFELIAQIQFNPMNPKSTIAPAKLHRLVQNDIWSLWKLELVVKGLRPNQFPRLWFAIKGNTMLLLCICTHIDNYDDNAMTKTALGRVTDYF